MKVDTKEMYESTLANGGYTLEREGVTGRYSVGLQVRGDAMPLDEFFENDIKNYIFLIDLEKLENVTIGSWINTETNMVFLDTVVLENDLDTALQIAIENEQIAIYDLLTDSEIRL